MTIPCRTSVAILVGGFIAALSVVSAQGADATTAADRPATAPAPVATWPQWRGPSRDGRAPGSAFPDSLKEDRLQPLWRVELAEGYSSPVVAEDRVFVVETRDKEKEVVRALDRATGKELWSTDWAGAMKVAFFAAGNGSWVRSTPAYDGQYLFVAGMRDVLVCLDARDGTVVWRVDFVERYKTPLPAFGFEHSRTSGACGSSLGYPWPLASGSIN